MKEIIFAICCLLVNSMVNTEFINPKNENDTEFSDYADDPKNPKVTIITAPSRFGRSTILDMVKKFTSLKSNATAHPVPPKENRNKALFCRHPFNICKNKTFMDKHFGVYPTIFIDYSPLKDVKDMESFLNAMKSIAYKTFKEHAYIGWNISQDDQRSNASEFDRELFLDPYSSVNINHLNTNELVNSFKLLSEYLHHQFNKTVIVLIDNYDAIWNSIMFNFGAHTRFMYKFFCGTNRAVLRDNPCLHKALAIGTIPLKVNIEQFTFVSQYYRFLGNHRFSKYFGFNERDVDHQFDIEITNSDREELRDKVRLKYGGYNIQGRNTSLYNPWSVLCFLFEKKLENYWANTQTFNNKTDIHHVKNISDIVFSMFFSTNIKVNIDEPFEIEDFIALARMNEDLEIEDESETQLYFRIIYHLGYLSPMGSTIDKVTVLDYPNHEVHTELSRVFLATAMKSISYK